MNVGQGLKGIKFIAYSISTEREEREGKKIEYETRRIERKMCLSLYTHKYIYIRETINLTWCGISLSCFHV